MQLTIKELRKQSGKTQAEMAKILGLSSANAYSLKERGERRFSIEEARVLSDVFGTVSYTHLDVYKRQLSELNKI